MLLRRVACDDTVLLLPPRRALPPRLCFVRAHGCPLTRSPDHPIMWGVSRWSGEERLGRGAGLRRVQGASSGTPPGTVQSLHIRLGVLPIAGRATAGEEQ